MDINQLSEIVKKKILDNQSIQEVYLEDKSFLHKKHSGNQPGKFHLKIIIKSDQLKKLTKIQRTQKIYKILDYEIKNFIHSVQILIN